MVPAKIVAGLGAPFLVVIGGVGTKLLLDSQKPITLEDAGVYGESSDNGKVGGKYKKHLLSTEGTDNANIWIKRVQDLASEGTEITIETGGFFNTTFKTPFETYRIEQKKTSGQNDLETKLQAAVSGLKKDCKNQYEKSETFGNESKWTEFWKFCSVDNQNKPTV